MYCGFACLRFLNVIDISFKNHKSCFTIRSDESVSFLCYEFFKSNEVDI